MITMIAAIDKNGGIGCRGELLFHIPEDMEHFKKVTLNHPVVMGRKTFESIKKPLIDRVNIVVTSRSDLYERDDILAIPFKDLDKSVSDLEKKYNEVFIIGGAQIYKYFVDKCDKIILTKYYKEYRGVDAYFPKFLNCGFKLNGKSKAYGVYNGYPFYIDEYITSRCT